MSVLGRTNHPGSKSDFVRYCPKADMCSVLADVRFVPIADIAALNDGGSIGLRIMRQAWCSRGIAATGECRNCTICRNVNHHPDHICDRIDNDH